MVCFFFPLKSTVFKGIWTILTVQKVVPKNGPNAHPYPSASENNRQDAIRYLEYVLRRASVFFRKDENEVDKEGLKSMLKLLTYSEMVEITVPFGNLMIVPPWKI